MSLQKGGKKIMAKLTKKQKTLPKFLKDKILKTKPKKKK